MWIFIPSNIYFCNSSHHTYTLPPILHWVALTANIIPIPSTSITARCVLASYTLSDVLACVVGVLVATHRSIYYQIYLSYLYYRILALTAWHGTTILLDIKCKPMLWEVLNDALIILWQRRGETVVIIASGVISIYIES